jgi:hypothetical protein
MGTGTSPSSSTRMTRRSVRSMCTMSPSTGCAQGLSSACSRRNVSERMTRRPTSSSRPKNPGASGAQNACSMRSPSPRRRIAACHSGDAFAISAAASYSSKRYCGWPYGALSLESSTYESTSMRVTETTASDAAPVAVSRRVTAILRSSGAPGCQAATSSFEGSTGSTWGKRTVGPRSPASSSAERAAAISPAVNGSSGWAVDSGVVTRAPWVWVVSGPCVRVVSWWWGIGILGLGRVPAQLTRGVDSAGASNCSRSVARPS